jgi:uncharacterized RDD family membrane protein YckC
VDLEDRITISTPDGIELSLALAGAGSRFIAAVVDFAIQAVLILLSALATLALLGGGIGTALFAMALFAALYLYDILFEVLAGGRTPGKRLTRLRVVRSGGAPVDLPASALRNLLRLIDLLPGAYLIGLLSILLTERNQRLGDLAAGTLVIREAPLTRLAPEKDAPPQASEMAGWDVSAVSAEELAAVRRFLARREELDRPARIELAHQLEQGLRKKVAGAPPMSDPERFLEALSLTKAAR